MRICAPAVLACTVALTAGCSPPIDLKQALQITDVVTGYHDAGVVDGKNKLVPGITFRLKKSVDDSLRPLSVNVSFKQLPEPGTAVPPGSPAETLGLKSRSERSVKGARPAPACRPRTGRAVGPRRLPEGPVYDVHEVL